MPICRDRAISTDAAFLSARGLAEFRTWFLRICLDQVTFMDGLLTLSTLTARLKLYVERRELRPEAFPLPEQILQRGEMPRGDAAQVTGLKERSTRDLLGTLIADGVLGSDTPKGAVSLRFPPACGRVTVPEPVPRNLIPTRAPEGRRPRRWRYWVLTGGTTLAAGGLPTSDQAVFAACAASCCGSYEVRFASMTQAMPSSRSARAWRARPWKRPLARKAA
jgi:hypothetical protein